MTDELESAPELEQDEVPHIDKRTSERRETVYVVLAQFSASGEDAWVEVDRVDASSRRDAITRAHANLDASSEALVQSKFKAVPQSSWKTVEVAEEPQPSKYVVREVDG